MPGVVEVGGALQSPGEAWWLVAAIAGALVRFGADTGFDHPTIVSTSDRSRSRFASSHGLAGAIRRVAQRLCRVRP